LESLSLPFFKNTVKKQLFYIVLAVFAFSGSLHAQRALDTIDTDLGKVVIYSNKTWSFLNVQKFDGVLNPRIHQAMLDQNLGFSHPWSNDVCFTSRNDLSRLKDTIWLCVNDESDKAFHMPAPGIVTSRYGPRNGRNHNGIDVDLETGDTVYATWSGKVRYAKYNDGGFGNLVIIRHPNGLETLYAHLSKFLVYPDQEVKAGEPIALGGNTGHSYGSHLHFEIRFYDSPMNPEEVIDFEKKEVKNENLFVHKGLFRPGAKPSDYYEDHPNEVIQQPVVVRTPQVRYYKVRPGDTLTEIADRNNTTVSKICQLNNIKPTTVLQVGRSLRVK
jgi:murein DD-endopeptidase MepM/ murein hydrolase activator NlpD